jgi:hypothetical protein
MVQEVYGKQGKTLKNAKFSALGSNKTMIGMQSGLTS